MDDVTAFAMDFFCVKPFTYSIRHFIKNVTVACTRASPHATENNKDYPHFDVQKIRSVFNIAQTVRISESTFATEFKDTKGTFVIESNITHICPDDQLLRVKINFEDWEENIHKEYSLLNLKKRSNK